MPFNGSGSYSPPGASFPAVSGAVIDSTKYNNVVNDIASALTNCVTKDGQTATVSDQAMGGYKHTGVGDAVARNNYASMGQVQDNAGIWGGTATGTADAITLTLSPAISAYTAGQEFIYKSSSSANTGAMTVNVNSVGAKAIQKNGQAMAAGDHPANAQFRIRYDGTAFQCQQVFQPSAFMLTVLDDTTAALARTTLGAVGLAGTETVTGSKTFSAANTFSSTLAVTGATTLTGLLEANGGANIAGKLGSAVIAAGDVGENMDVNLETGSAVALTSATAKTVVSRSLTAGKWEVGGVVNFNFGATTQVLSLFGGSSLVDNTQDGYQFSHRCAAFAPGALSMGYSIPPREIDIDVTTTVYLVATAGFTTSTCSAWGYMRIRRIA